MNRYINKGVVLAIVFSACGSSQADSYLPFPMAYGVEKEASESPTALMGILMQPTFTYQDRSDRQPAEDDTSNFSFQRLRWYVKGSVNEDIDYLLVTEWARNAATSPSDGGARAFRARATFRDLGDLTNLAVGSIIVPFGHAFYVPAGSAPWVNYTRMTSTLYGCGSIDCTPDQNHTITNVWKTGAMAFDQIHLGNDRSVTYTAGFYNSSGTSFQDDGTNKDFNGSLEYHSGNFFAHYGVRLGSQQNNLGNEMDRKRHAVVLRYNNYLKDKWWLWGEYMTGTDETVGADLEADGYEFSVGYKLTKKWEAVARYSEFDPNDSVSEDQYEETSLGITYAMNNGVRWQLQADFENNESNTVDDTIYTARLTIPLGVKIK